jgi:hypothetical protein
MAVKKALSHFFCRTGFGIWMLDLLTPSDDWARSW